LTPGSDVGVADLKGTTEVVHVLEPASQAFHRLDGYRAGGLLVELSGRPHEP